MNEIPMTEVVLGSGFLSEPRTVKSVAMKFEVDIHTASQVLRNLHTSNRVTKRWNGTLQRDVFYACERHWIHTTPFSRCEVVEEENEEGRWVYHTLPPKSFGERCWR